MSEQKKHSKQLGEEKSAAGYTKANGAENGKGCAWKIDPY